MIVRARAALAAIAWACLAARAAGQTKQCDPSIPEIIFRRKVLDDAATGGVAVLAADLNGDSDVDIAAAFYSSEEFRWYKNKLYSNTTNGNITFNQATVAQSSAPSKPHSIHAADVDGDGNVDLLLSYGVSNPESFVSWHENDATKTPFKTGTTEHTISKGTTVGHPRNVPNPVDVHGADVDGDGEVDVLVAVQNVQLVTLFVNEGTNTAAGVAEVPFADPTTSTYVLLNDIDNNEYGDNLQKPFSVFAADVDGDTDLDVLVAAEDAGYRITLYVNDGAQPPVFAEEPIVDTTLADVRDVWAVDLDNDNKLELLVASNSDGITAWYENDGTTTWYASANIEHTLTDPVTINENPTNNNALGVSAVRVGDFDGDGLPDIVFAGAGLAQTQRNKVVWLQNKGDLTNANNWDKETVGQILGAATSPQYYLEVADFDEDGDFDVVLASYENGLLWFMNDCAAEPTPAPTADVPTSVPTGIPTSYPSAVPISAPTALPTTPPSSQPTSVPTTLPSPVPTVPPTAVPTGAPTSEPTGRPTVPPTALPTGVPTTLPSSVPTVPPTPIPAPIPTPAPTPRPSVRCSAGVTFSTEHNVEALGRYLNVHVVDGAKIKVARRLPRPSARRRGTG